MIPKQRLEEYIKMLIAARESHYELMNHNLKVKHDTGFLMEQYYAQSLTVTIEQLTEILEEQKSPLEELGYEMGQKDEKSVSFFKSVGNDTNYVDLAIDGTVTFINAYMVQELFVTQKEINAIEQEMKNRGWWK